jgi:hypothetical protein
MPVVEEHFVALHPSGILTEAVPPAPAIMPGVGALQLVFPGLSWTQPEGHWSHRFDVPSTNLPTEHGVHNVVESTVETKPAGQSTHVVGSVISSVRSPLASSFLL